MFVVSKQDSGFFESKINYIVITDLDILFLSIAAQSGKLQVCTHQAFCWHLEESLCRL